MIIALRLKFQLNPRYNMAVRKNDEHIKHRLGSLTQMFIRYYPLFLVAEEKENRG